MWVFFLLLLFFKLWHLIFVIVIYYLLQASEIAFSLLTTNEALKKNALVTVKDVFC